MKKNKLRVIGFVPDRESIEQDIALEDLKYWSKQPVQPLVNNYKPQKFELTETAKYVFGKSISLFKL